MSNLIELDDFTEEELSCNCGCGSTIEDNAFRYHLQVLRNKLGFPMNLSSAKRCPEYNEKVSSSGVDGPHTIAAVDVLVFGDRAFKLIEQAMRLGFTGIGVSQKGHWHARFVHLDRLNNRPAPFWIWSY